MKTSRLLTVLVGGVFCLAVMSLYRMLELMQGAELQEHPDTPGGQVDNDLSRLQQKIDELERLLSDNNRLVATLRDSLLQHKASWGKGGGANVSSDSAHSPADTLPGCRLANEMKDETDGVQLLDVYDLLPFDNPDGGAWKQGFEISYHGNEWDEQPLELFLVPHSHNDPGWLKTFDGYYQDQTRHILNNMLIKLSEDSRRKMIWAEISYFSKWWNDIDEQKREMVKRCEAEQRLGCGSVRPLPLYGLPAEGGGAPGHGHPASSLRRQEALRPATDAGVSLATELGPLPPQ